ncbi:MULTISPECIES: transcription termination factor NusA [Sedimentibacter]|uniref:Transcription termination/antitermination protein NusA n=1 Tax=Sedimentibacter hydroxybenzoicus DSM 7310 TaxID=1123245 RepID=A0A974BKK6_SEDHY|nr:MULTISPECIES: transcription termination factor NusA [Sedimentibacter]NYB74375.1 transcription termination/antitermination protein NusA [Sedimentibacter hydroxybenzoicus DSM 7310]
MNKEILSALSELEKEKGIRKDVVLEAIKAALETGYKKNFSKATNFSIDIDEENGEYRLFQDKVVSEIVENPNQEITLSEAKSIDSKYEIDDVVKIEIKPKKDFGRIAAQTARQVILQKIREAERESIFSEFYGRESDILTGIVQRESKGNIYVDLGKIEGIITPGEQIPGEVYNTGDRIKTVIVEVKNSGKGASIMLSRSHPNLVKRLFELEVPEIHDGTIEIFSISREAGSRTKIAVFSHDSNVEPIGSCVGNKGVRVKNIIDEINQEKIDIIIYDKDPEKFIANSLGPAKIVKVTANEKEKSAVAVVPDNQLSLAIGKEGQNVRLAAKLTGWKIDIISETQEKERSSEEEI